MSASGQQQPPLSPCRAPVRPQRPWHRSSARHRARRPRCQRRDIHRGRLASGRQGSQLAPRHPDQRRPALRRPGEARAPPRSVRQLMPTPQRTPRQAGEHAARHAFARLPSWTGPAPERPRPRPARFAGGCPATHDPQRRDRREPCRTDDTPYHCSDRYRLGCPLRPGLVAMSRPGPRHRPGNSRCAGRAPHRPARGPALARGRGVPALCRPTPADVPDRGSRPW